MMRSFLQWFVRFLCLPLRVITRDDGKPYLERWYLCGEAGGLKYFPDGQQKMRWWQHAFTWLPCVYVHRFVASDDDEELHNHPWEATSLILAGGYVEERLDRSEVVLDLARAFGLDGGKDVLKIARAFKPWSVNRIYANTFHKVSLIEDDCWTLLACGKKVGTWGFLDVAKDEFVHWREHVARRARKAAGLTPELDDVIGERQRDAILALHSGLKKLGFEKRVKIVVSIDVGGVLYAERVDIPAKGERW